jgi:predicted RNase H-like HicB family nuclease
MQYAIVIELGTNGCSAYVPDLPGCVAVAESEAKVKKLIREAIEFHIEGLRLNGDPVPEPTSHVGYVEVAQVAA